MDKHIFKAMADPTRRKILELLKDGPQTAGEIASHFSSAQPTISRHLNVLKNADLVADEREGSFIIYRLNTTILQEWLARLLAHFGGGDSDEAE